MTIRQRPGGLQRGAQDVGTVLLGEAGRVLSVGQLGDERPGAGGAQYRVAAQRGFPAGGIAVERHGDAALRQRTGRVGRRRAGRE